MQPCYFRAEANGAVAIFKGSASSGTTYSIGARFETLHVSAYVSANIKINFSIDTNDATVVSKYNSGQRFCFS